MKRFLGSVAALSVFACSGGNAPAPAQPAAPATIPVTSKSPQAMDHFEKGQTLLDNLRPAEAAEELSEALNLDPDFATAHALHAQAVPGPEGLKELEQAAAYASSLPQAERVYIEAVLATRQGDLVKSTELWKQLTQLAPGDWRAEMGLGLRHFSTEKYDEAAQAFRRATELNPQAGPAFNMLGYATLRQGAIDPSIEAFKRYTAVNPQEPNAQDSLGEVLLAGGKFPDAEAAFRKAAELSPRFWNAWEGVAYTKFFAGDWAAGRDALVRARAAAERTADKVNVEEVFALEALAEGKTADALKGFDAAEKVAGAQPSDVALVPVHRALALVDAGRPREALSQLAGVLQRADSGQFPGGLSRNLRRQALSARALAEATMKDAAAVEKTVAALEQEASSRPDDPLLQSALHFARGMMAVAKNDLKEAGTHFQACSAQDFSCQWQGILAAERAGDRATADAGRERIMRVYVRDPGYLYVWSRLNRAAGKKA